MRTEVYRDPHSGKWYYDVFIDKNTKNVIGEFKTRKEAETSLNKALDKLYVDTTIKFEGINNNEEIHENFLDVKDICRILKIGKTKAYEIIKSNSFPCIKLGKQYRIPEKEFYKWLNLKIAMNY